MTAVERLDLLDALRVSADEVAPLPWEVWGPHTSRYVGLGANDSDHANALDMVEVSMADGADRARRLVEMITALVNDAPALTRALRVILDFATELERPVFRTAILRTPMEEARHAGADDERRKIALILRTRIDHALDGDN